MKFIEQYDDNISKMYEEAYVSECDNMSVSLVYSYTILLSMTAISPKLPSCYYAQPRLSSLKSFLFLGFFLQ